MIYLVSNQQSLFDDYFDFKPISTEESIRLFNKVNLIQFDTETTGRNPQLDKILCMQLGSKKLDCQLVVDLTTVNILEYKNLLESKMLILQNAKFDLQFLFNHGIVPRKIYDTMIVEQLLHLGFPYLTLTKEEYIKFKCTYPYHTMFKDGKEYFVLSYALDAIAWKRLGVVLDKSVRGEIIWRGLDSVVIKYAADDVVYLEDIMHSQIAECKAKGCLVGAKLECDFVPAISYLEWCGVKLDIPRWKNKMANDQKNLDSAKKALDDFIIRQENPAFKKYIYVNTQGDLFSGFDLTPKCILNWSSSKQVIEIAKLLGFNTVMQDKKTGEDKDSVLEKHLNSQKGINDEFLKLYFSYQEYAKVVSSFGQGHLNDVLPETGRIYTNWKQLGAASGRMSCGSTQSNESLARHKHLKSKECSYPNLQQLPHDAETRACFIAEKGNAWISCDYGSEEARLAGDIYQDEAIIEMFLKGIDSHSMYAKIFFKDELKDIDVNDVKKLRPDLRQLSKGPEFALNFGGGVFAIMQAINCTQEKAEEIIRNYEEGFKGTAEFARKGTIELKKNGYVLINPITGHKMWWWDFQQWKERQASFDSDFWEKYKAFHKGTGDSVEMTVKMHFKAVSKWSRMVRNAPTQGELIALVKLLKFGEL